MSPDQVKKTLDEIHDRLAAADGEIVERYPLAEYLRAFDESDLNHGYHHIPELADRWTREIVDNAGAWVLEDYNRLALATLIRDRDHRASSLRIPQSVQDLREQAFDRIVSQFDSAQAGFHSASNDLFAKDFALCRGKLLPCGAEHLDVSSGIPRRVVLQGGAGQFFRGLSYFIGGRRRFRPWLEGHWDRRLAREFNERGYNRSYVRIAELLELNPAIQGLSGSSWWYDPALGSISPGLAFLRRVPLDGGAVEFLVGEDRAAAADALHLSRERAAAHEAGRYHPRVWLNAWGRDQLIAWARAR